MHPKPSSVSVAVAALLIVHTFIVSSNGFSNSSSTRFDSSYGSINSTTESNTTLSEQSDHNSGNLVVSIVVPIVVISVVLVSVGLILYFLVIKKRALTHNSKATMDTTHKDNEARPPFKGRILRYSKNPSRKQNVESVADGYATVPAQGGGDSDYENMPRLNANPELGENAYENVHLGKKSAKSNAPLSKSRSEQSDTLPSYRAPAPSSNIAATVNTDTDSGCRKDVGALYLSLKGDPPTAATKDIRLPLSGDPHAKSARGGAQSGIKNGLFHFSKRGKQPPALPIKEIAACDDTYEVPAEAVLQLPSRQDSQDVYVAPDGEAADEIYQNC